MENKHRYRTNYVNKLIKDKYECKDLDELENKLQEINNEEINFELFHNINNLCAYEKGKTKLLLVGTMIPHGYHFYYFNEGTNGGDFMYGKIIDSTLGTNLNAKRRMINCLFNEGNEDKAQDLLQEFINNLKEIGIAFVDVFDKGIHKINRNEDKYIQYYTINRAFFKKVKSDKNVEVIAMTALAEGILKERVGIINSKYIQYFYTDGSGYIDLIKRLLNH